MNRLRIWVYALVVLAAGAAGVVSLSRWLTARSVAQLDRELHAAVVAEQITTAGADAVGAALAALPSARRSPSGEAPPVLVAVATKVGVAARAAGAPVELDADGPAIVSVARASTGCGLTLVLQGHKERSTLGPSDVATVLAAVRGVMGRPVSAGRLGRQSA